MNWKKLSRALSNLLPWRPHQPKGTHLSWRVRIKGYSKNIKLHPGCRVLEDVMLHIHDDRSSVEIGQGTMIMPFAKLVTAEGGFIRIGSNCTIHSFDVLYGFSGGLQIGNNVRIGVNATFVTGNHRTEDPALGPNEQGSSSLGIEIGDGCWIGAGAIILDGVRLAPKSIVGAGAVVTKSRQGRVCLVGVPAKPMLKQGYVS